tara:strand:+ start:2366 stop:3304 length:939 start_codon:yes stop_codon:yes gene_type:complete
MKKIIFNKKYKNCIASIAIGQQHFLDWQKYSKPYWVDYCKKNKLNLIIFDKLLIKPGHIYFKKINWQKLLIGDEIKKNFKNIKNVCYLDTDILINFSAPNIFKNFDKNKISVVSKRFRLSYDYDKTVKKIAFFRKKFVNKKYSLNSAINISLKKLYKIHNLEVQKDEFCSGVYVFNVSKYSRFMRDIFFKYDKNVKSITNNGDQTHINYEFQKNAKVKFIDYKYQTIWLYELINYYPFLLFLKDQKLTSNCVTASLFNCYFLHFAGTGPESNVWKNKSIISKSYMNRNFLNEYNRYLKKKITKLNLNFFKLS